MAGTGARPQVGSGSLGWGCLAPWRHGFNRPCVPGDRAILQDGQRDDFALLRGLWRRILWLCKMRYSSALGTSLRTRLRAPLHLILNCEKSNRVQGGYSAANSQSSSIKAFATPWPQFRGRLVALLINASFLWNSNGTATLKNEKSDLGARQIGFQLPSLGLGVKPNPSSSIHPRAGIIP